MLRVALLGELSITDDLAGTIRARSARTAALVAFLVRHAGSAQPRHRIAGLFWPESGEAQALTNLRRELHQLRQVLGEEPALVVTGRDLCWQDTATCRVDVRIFDRERRAAAAAAEAGGMQAVLRKRFEQATAAAREVAGLAAAARTNFTFGLLAEASDLDADTVVQAVDELWRLRIMREFGDGYDFAHEMLREAAYAEVSPPRRWLLHRRIAQSLELLHAGDVDAAMTGTRRPPAAPPSRWPGASATRTTWPSPWPTQASPARCATTCPS